MPDITPAKEAGKPASKGRVLPDLNALQAELDALKAKNAALEAKAAKATTFTLKVSAKGAVSAYGLGRFPVTLYAGQWVKLLDQQNVIRDFISENKLPLERPKT